VPGVDTIEDGLYIIIVASVKGARNPTGGPRMGRIRGQVKGIQPIPPRGHEQGIPVHHHLAGPIPQLELVDKHRFRTRRHVVDLQHGRGRQVDEVSVPLYGTGEALGGRVLSRKANRRLVPKTIAIAVLEVGLLLRTRVDERVAVVAVSPEGNIAEAVAILIAPGRVCIG
jgi:hypothetical protein